MSNEREQMLVGRRGFVGSALAVSAALVGSNNLAAQEATPAATSYRLMTLSPEELGAPAVPEASVSTAEKARSYAQETDPYKEYGTDAAPGEFPRTVRHVRGETVIESKPKTVATLELGAIDFSVEIGVKPAAIIDPFSSIGVEFTPETAAFLEGIPDMGDWAEPNLEELINVAPDLILIPAGDDARDDQLQQIAPTVFRSGSGMVWKHNFALFAQSMGEEEKGEQVILRYEERVRAMNALLPDPRPSISFLRVLGDHVRYMLRTNFSAMILTDLGFPRPEAQNIDDFALTNMSLETLGQYADADIIVVATDAGEDAQKFSQEMLDSGAWNSLDAVKNDKVLMVSNSTWIGGIGYGGAHAVLDDIAAYFGINA